MSRLDLDDRGVPRGYPFKPELEVPAREVQRSLSGAEPVTLIDVRTQEEWDLSRVPGSVLIPLHELEQRADEIDAARHAPIAVLCHHGARSLKGALVLRALGFTQARSVVGGIDLWARDVDPAVPRYDRVGARFARLPTGAP